MERPRWGPAQLLLQHADDATAWGVWPCAGRCAATTAKPWSLGWREGLSGRVDAIRISTRFVCSFACHCGSIGWWEITSTPVQPRLRHGQSFIVADLHVALFVYLQFSLHWSTPEMPPWARPPTRIVLHPGQSGIHEAWPGASCAIFTSHAISSISICVMVLFISIRIFWQARIGLAGPGRPGIRMESSAHLLGNLLLGLLAVRIGASRRKTVLPRIGSADPDRDC